MASDPTELTQILTAAVADCARDGRVALQISGGLDSAIIQRLAPAPWHLYCCTWPEVDNLRMAQLAAGPVRVRPVTFTRDEMLAVLPEIARITDGRGTWSQVCQWFMARAAAADGCTVVLNGEGADELFGGYARYAVLFWLDQMRADLRLEAYRPLVEQAVGTSFELVTRMLSRVAPGDVACRQAATADWDRGLVGAMAGIEERHGLVELVAHERDIAAAHGLEHRWPYLDPRVVDFAHRLEPGEFCTSIYTKPVLRAVARLVGVPAAIIEETTKRGLYIPQEWRPDGEPMWSRNWFTRLMREAHAA